MAKTQKQNKDFRRVKKGNLAVKLRSARAIQVIELRYKIVEYRTMGYSIKQIADELGINPVTVYKYLDEILTNTIIKYQETTEQMRQIQLEQIDRIVKAFTPTGTDTTQQVVKIDGRDVVITCPPDPAAARVLLDALNRRAKLMALDMPETKKMELSGMRVYSGVDMEQV